MLQPVRRRRRRRYVSRLLLPGGLALVALTAGAFVLFQQTGGHRLAERLSAGRTAALHSAAEQKVPVPLGGNLLAGAPLFQHPLAPPLGARAAILVASGSGRVLWTKQAHLRLPIASTTKIMTALLVLHRLPLDIVVPIGRTVPRVPLVREGLRAGERVPAWKLLYGLLLYSGNDDALALAIATSGSRGAFIALMNREARRLGLADTRYASPSGVIDDGNYSSAWDLAALSRYAMRDARFRKIVRTRRIQVSWAAPTYSKIYLNKNRLLTLYRGAVGIKTGWTTRSGPCLVAAATRDGVGLIAVVLDSQRPYNDAARLLNLGFASLG